ncbi:MAG: hypothetical protein MUC56_16760 [Thermoanaerobaculales bacterium]|nr:hypothetical protein [Thermoanaerobaculales bacterium]
MNNAMSNRCGKRGMVAAVALLVFGMAAASGSASEPDGTIGPDVVVFSVSGTYNWGASGDLRAYSVGTTSCNRGDEPLNWISSTNQHPVISQNLYRVTLPSAGPPVEHGTIEMLGISWLKHGFVSVNGATAGCGSCPGNPPGSQLGVGCTDPYSSSLNGSQSRLGPRSEVNAFTGYFVYPHASPSGDPTLAGRLVVAQSEVVDDPAHYRYFVEGQYVAPDDAGAGNALNNASHRAVDVNGTDLDVVGPTEEGRPGIYAWSDLDPEVIVREVEVPGEGMFIVATKTGDNGDGTWHYEYAVFNLNSHLSGRSFSVPILPDSVITNIGFRDVAYHSGEPYDGTDWAAVASPGSGWMTWSTDDFATNPNANALRWSTMYTFGFDASSPPEDALASIGLFRDGGPSSVSVYVRAPASNLIPLFADDFESGGTGAWAVVSP